MQSPYNQSYQEKTFNQQQNLYQQQQHQSYLQQLQQYNSQQEQYQLQRSQQIPYMSKNIFENNTNQRQNAQSVRSLIHFPDVNSTLFNPDYERFNKDFCKNEKIRRDNEYQQYQTNREKHTLVILERQQERYKHLEQVQRQLIDKQRYKTALLSSGVLNTTGKAQNPINFNYENNLKGFKQKKLDDQEQVRKFVRAENIDNRTHCGYNIITGKSRNYVDNLVPMDLKNDYYRKIQQKNEFYQLRELPK